mmetsp:Transcript_9240/g.24292  ORF Transcript_9240/g.24292 Transcript_9240/m.24292 type:complete len:266 (-) Transcript_9240:127-924(-)|eukprot:CAMPEP_0117536084 /NCGR_PEP_ID=MMETSP0784-20121206/41268_1 /TAXON_ID=39447 /ORGANISM="" /LENGTH=265 /DNA_ID=CAMNT_0005332631 /DNA_START=140 /DNA_END=937 /DNA_ORIENTATION=+
MELHVVSTEGIPDDCVLSVRAGSTRRQAPVTADRPFRFPTEASEALPFKVDVLEPVASARLILRPGEERRTDCQYTIPLEAAASADGKATASPKNNDATEAAMSVTIAVRPSDDAKDENSKTGGDGDASRPDSSKGPKRATSSASSRHGQASAAREYLDQHNLVEFTQLLVQSVIKEQPDRPYEFMARQFYFPDPKPRPNTSGAVADGVHATFGVPSPTPPPGSPLTGKRRSAGVGEVAAEDDNFGQAGEPAPAHTIQATTMGPL